MIINTVEAGKSIKVFSMTIPICFKPAFYILFLCFISAAGCKHRQTEKKLNKRYSLTILYTGRANGEIKPCGCSKEGDKGGLLRRSSFVKKIRKEKKNVILLDGGDNFKETSEQGMYKAELISNSMMMIGYDGMAPGEKDLIYGEQFLFSRFNNILLAANISSRNKEFAAPISYKIISFDDGLKAAVIGIVDPALFYSGSHSNISINDINSSLNPIIRKINRQDVRLIILLGHLSARTVSMLAGKGIAHIIINGHRKDGDSADGAVVLPEDHTTAYKNRPILVFPRERGQEIGVLDIVIEGENRYIKNSFVPLLSDLKDDEDLIPLFDEYNRRVEMLFFKTMKNKKNKKKDFVSQAKCLTCHKKEYDIWKKTRHAGAYGSLKEVGRNHDPECVVCHTLGFNKTGGFIGEESTPSLKNVQCENCHGPGEKHISSPDLPYGKEANKKCNTCHNNIHSPAFKYEDYWRLIRH